MSLQISIFAKTLQSLYRPVIRRAAGQIVQGRLLDPDTPRRGRWTAADVDAFLEQTWERVDTLLPRANLEEIPTWGNRHNVYLAVVTTAAYRALLDRGLERDYAMELVADMGWKIYRRLLKLAARPFELTSSDPATKIRRTLDALLVFPFNAPGEPGYEVDAWTEGDRYFTHWRHCPPEAFVRRIAEEGGPDGEDRGELEAFARSWCRYDWAAADELAGDGHHGHYERPHTLSRGDEVCDMCWHARPIGEDAPRDAARPGSPESELDVIEEIYEFWGEHPAAYVLQDYVTFLGRPRQIRRRAVEALEVGRGDSVLEIGCGTGRNFEYIQETIGPTGRLVGVDYSAEMLEAAAALCRRRGWDNVELVKHDAATMELESDLGGDPFDGVLCALALSAIPGWEETLRRARQALKPGGRLSVCDARLFQEGPTFLNPLVEAVYRQLAGWHPHRDIPAAIEEIFGAVDVESFNLGTLYVAAAAR